MALPDKSQVLDASAYRGLPFNNVLAYAPTPNLGYRGLPYIAAMGSEVPPPTQYQPMVMICM
jgi:hypothetical protein